MSPMTATPSQLLLGTRKGLLQLARKGDQWDLFRESFVGIPVVYAMHDTRTGTLWAALEHGHWGAKLHRSADMGQTWDEVLGIKYPENAEKKPGEKATIELVWYIREGGLDEPQRLYLGTNPGGLFSSNDGGATFELNRPLWDHPSRVPSWFGGGRDSAGLSSLFVDPRDSSCMIVGASCGGVFATSDGGKTWEGRNQGLRADFLPDPNAPFGHDPHFMIHCESKPDVLWQQNHCGIFRSENAGRTWTDVSEPNGPARFGWAIAADPLDPLTAWVVPAAGDDMRLATGRALCVCRTQDGGKTWQALRQGLPQESTYDIVYRHALDQRAERLAFGSTTGNLYLSSDRGEHWTSWGGNLPPVYSVRFA